MPLLKLLLNISFISALLLGPACILLANWYRNSFKQPIMVWKRPEAIVASVAYLVVSLVLMIVGISCFFNYIRSLEVGPLHAHEALFRDVSMLCFGLLAGLGLLFIALKKVWVQVVTDEGIVVNHFLLRVPVVHQVIRWEQITDYYVQPDYPNRLFYVLYRQEGLEIERITIPVPDHLQAYFRQTLDAKLDGETDIPMYRYRKSKGLID